jgi:hypothetical protein
MMSGGSPTPHHKLSFELKETVINPPINVKCMQDKAVQCSPNHMDETTSAVTVHQTLAAHELDHSHQTQHCPAIRTTPNRWSLENEEAIEHIEEIPLSAQVQAKSLDMTDEQISHGTDKIDGTWPKEEEHKLEDGCGIQCLYYTMQCCDCTIL